MENTLIKQITKSGNSACVMLPKKYLNGMAKIEIIQEPRNITKEILEILEQNLKGILGIYLIGSYARGEQTEKSDIDILVITENENKKITKGKYEIMLISKESLEKTLKNNILPLLPMLKEAKSILNEQLIKNYKEIKLSKKNLKWHIETTKSMLKMQKEFISLAELEEENMPDGIMYSLILRLRETYIIDCLKNNEIPTSEGIKKLIRDLTNSEESYDAYLRCKSNEKEQEIIKTDIAKKIYDYIKDKMEEQNV